MCKNPFFNCTTLDSDVVLDIQLKGVSYPTCEKCWIKIADSEDYEWTQEQQTTTLPVKDEFEDYDKDLPELKKLRIT